MRFTSLISLIVCAVCVASQTHGAGEAVALDLGHAQLAGRADEVDSAALMRRSTAASRRKALARRSTCGSKRHYCNSACRKKAAAAAAAKKKAEEEASAAAKKKAAQHAAASKKAAAAAAAKKIAAIKAAADAKAPTSGSKSLSTGNPIVDDTHSGDATFFTVGLGACGWTNTGSQAIVAVSHVLYDAYPGATANPNDNPVCGKKIEASWGGHSVQVTVVDKCMGCAEYDLDFSPTTFSNMADLSVGRLHEMTWRFLD